MATTTDQSQDGPVSAGPVLEDAAGQDEISTRLDAIDDELRSQRQGLRNAQRAWSIFAVFALLIAGVNLIAVAAKLDKKSTSKTVAAAPAAGKAATPAPAAANPGKVGVSLKEFSVAPTATSAPAGRVTFNVRNNGSVTHEFVVIRTNKPAGALLKGEPGEADETGNVGETGDLQPGTGKAVTLNLAAGHYALICNLPGHYKAGQHTDFTVK